MQLAANIVISASIIALLASGANLAMLATRRIPVILAAAMTVAGYSFHALWLRGLPLVVATALAVFSGMTLACTLDAVERRVFEPNGEHASGWASVAFALGFLIVIQAMVALACGAASRTFSIGRPVYQIADIRLTAPQVLAIGTAVVLLAALAWVLFGTRLGLRLRALRSNPFLCTIIGMRTSAIRCMGVALAGLFAGVAMVFQVVDGGLILGTGFSLLLVGLTAAIVGGAGSFGGGISGAVLLATVRNLCGYYGGASWTEIGTFATLVVVLIARPLGVLGSRLKKVEI